MSTAAITAAIANRSIRTIRAELEFLADTAIISSTSLSHILSLLPAEQSARSPPISTAAAAGPVPKSTTPAVSHPTFTPPPSTNTPQRVLPVAPVAPPSYTPTPVISLAEALWAFSGTEPGDLSFQAGDKLEILEKVKDDWWKGRVVGSEHTGLFPSSYVRETQVLVAQKEKPPLPSLPPRNNGGGYGPGGNPMTDVAHGTSVFEHQQQEEAAKKPLLGKNGEKFGKKLGNAAIFGAGATIGGKIVNTIF
ncbi:protein that induces appearance of [PIN+] prion when overproduced [Maublancomyces gigas]|uniref:Protein that induces appearance of [PIN+] prion when overproduced n=1 Tax=Discina gigas TaxID=1032678 RepID=A0ABR3GU01_9PEZI